MGLSLEGRYAGEAGIGSEVEETLDLGNPRLSHLPESRRVWVVELNSIRLICIRCC